MAVAVEVVAVEVVAEAEVVTEAVTEAEAEAGSEAEAGAEAVALPVLSELEVAWLECEWLGSV